MISGLEGLQFQDLAGSGREVS
ncbi:MAG: hypothetical protein RIT19_3022, partial [Verrucomicrobiota bacterium]